MKPDLKTNKESNSQAVHMPDVIYMQKAVMFRKYPVGIAIASTKTLTAGANNWLAWIVDSYGHCLTEYRDYTPAEFAEEIRKVYDEREPHNAKAIDVLQQFDELNDA